jgi:acyl-coenzyme A thioesterase PaaI-like protein
MPIDYRIVEMTPEQLEADRRVWGGLADSVRALAEASLRTTVAPDVATEVAKRVDELTELLRAEQIEGSYGVSVTRDGRVLGHGNAVVGMRNPVAVPLQMERSPEGRAWASFHLNALYEGPPTKVHGGVSALILDQVLGEAAAAGGSPGMTGTLTLRYRRNLPLGDCSVEGWIDSQDGPKTVVRGVIRDADGNDCVEAEGVFILPRWAREQLERSGNRPPKFE